MKVLLKGQKLMPNTLQQGKVINLKPGEEVSIKTKDLDCLNKTIKPDKPCCKNCK